MSKSKNIKQYHLQPYRENSRLTQNDVKSSTTLTNNVILDENQVTLLTQWLEQLNQQQLITITEQNDIVIMAGGGDDQTQQVFINCADIDAHMKTKTSSNKTTANAEIVEMSDIARILLKCGYVDGSSGQLSFLAQTISLDSDELKWLISIVRTARPNSKSRETQVELFDGENSQLLYIPYEHMTPTNDPRTVAIYLFRNGQVRYDVDTKTYLYRYIEPDILLGEKTKSAEHVRQRQFLSYHIRRVHVDKQNERVELEFLGEPNHLLVLPASWYRHALANNFDRNYIIDILLANGGVIDRDAFVFMNRAYSLQAPHLTAANLKTVDLTVKQKTDLIRRYVDSIIEQDGVKQDNTDQLLLLESAADGRQLYFTSEHSQWIRENQFKQHDVIHLLVEYGQIKQDESGNWLLYYNNQYIPFPSAFISSSKVSSHDTNKNSRSGSGLLCCGSQKSSQPTKTTVNNTSAQARSPQQYHNTIDYMCRHGLVTWDKRLKLIRLNFSDQTLLIPINHLRSIVDQHIVSSPTTADGVLPFSSRQLSQWLLDNSYMTRSTR